MASGISLVKTGFNFVDNRWGGVYQGGSYVVIGQHKSGRTLLGLQCAVEAARSSDVCLYFTNMRPKDLMIQAASLNFNIQSYMNKNLLVVVRVAPPSDLADVRNHDEFLIEYMNDIVAVVGQYNPKRIVFDELTPYIGFKDIDLLRDVFLHTLETIEDRDITSFFILGDPATEKAAALVETIASVVTGRIYLRKTASRFDADGAVGTATIVPNVGHNEGKFSKEYVISPRRGVIVEGEDQDEPELAPIRQETKPKAEPVQVVPKTVVEPPKPAPKKVEDKPAPEKVILKKTSATVGAEPFKFSNVYTESDFQLILNNQIALFKSTGQPFNLLTFKLDPAAIVNSIMTMKQFEASIKGGVDKKDKICVFDNKIVVLVVKSSEERVQSTIEGIKEHFPSKDSAYIEKAMEYIAIFNKEADDSIANAEKLVEYVTSSDQDNEEFFVPYSKFSV